MNNEPLTIKIKEGITMVNRYGDDFNIQFVPKESSIDEIVVEFKEFLLACGYSPKAVDEWVGGDE